MLGGMWGIAQLRNLLYGVGSTEFHGLPTASNTRISLAEKITVEDKSAYAADETLDFYQYTRRFYDENVLIAKADYDKDGNLFQWSEWEYDTAGNLCREQIDNLADGAQTNRHIYEYDNLDRVVHEEIYWDEDLAERNYFQYTDAGRAGVSYSYHNENMYGGIAPYCSAYTEFLEDEEGNTLCAFWFHSPESKRPFEAWKMQWMRQGSQIVNRVQIYLDNPQRIAASLNQDYDDRNVWYQFLKDADAEQVNLYEYNPETGEKNPTLQLNYEWVNEENAFCLTPSFYRAQYDGDNLLWQMLYADGRLAYYSAYQYDTDRRLETVVEYEAEEESPCALLYRYEYPEKDTVDEYIYGIQGAEFSHLLGDERNVLEEYEFSESGEIADEAVILEKLEEEAEASGFRVGENLEGCGKESSVRKAGGLE